MVVEDRYQQLLKIPNIKKYASWTNYNISGYSSLIQTLNKPIKEIIPVNTLHIDPCLLRSSQWRNQNLKTDIMFVGLNPANRSYNDKEHKQDSIVPDWSNFHDVEQPTNT